jgi:hypothetical protein
MTKQILIAALLISTVTTVSALAASSGTLTVSGTVATVNDISITPNGSNNTTLNITAGESAKNIAAVSETSNDILGYKINLSSANAGELQNASDVTKKTTYTISYNGGSYVTPSNTPAQVKNVSSLAALTTNTSQVLINVVAFPGAVAGTYSDTITLAIVAN